MRPVLSQKKRQIRILENLLWDGMKKREASGCRWHEGRLLYTHTCPPYVRSTHSLTWWKCGLRMAHRLVRFRSCLSSKAWLKVSLSIFSLSDCNNVPCGFLSVLLLPKILSPLRARMILKCKSENVPTFHDLSSVLKYHVLSKAPRALHG